MAEQDPEGWWDAAIGASKAACSGAGLSNVDAIGITAQSDSLALIDGHGRSLRPSLLWMDRRGMDEAALFESVLGRRQIHAHTGLRSAFNFTAPKAAFIRHHEPQVFARARWLLQPKDFLYSRLTGEIATDPSSASRTLAFDIHRQDWWPDALEVFGLDSKTLPSVLPSTAAMALSPQAARSLDLKAGTPVVIGAADRAAELLGLAIAGTDALVSTGTATGIARVCPSTKPIYDDRVITPRHALADEMMAMLSIPTSGAILEWLARLTAPSAREPVALLLREAARRPSGAGGVFAIPTFMGARSFRWDPSARGALVGLDLGTSRGDLARAVVEGIAFEIAACLVVLRASTGPIERLALTGGVHESTFMCQLITDITQTPAVRYRDRNGALAGAMLLAGTSVGAWSDPRSMAAARIGEPRSFRPEPAAAAIYGPLARQYALAVEGTISFARAAWGSREAHSTEAEAGGGIDVEQ